ncbi:hypothetical protein ACET3Z_008845 [Daucus carota]
MGMEIGKSRGLFWRGAPKDMQNVEGAYRTEGLILDLTMSAEKHVDAKIFEQFSNLRLLEIIGAHDIKGNLKDLFHELRVIRWHGCSWTYLPPSFRPQNLVSLDMSMSNLEKFWKSPTVTPLKQLANLTHMNLAGCVNLKQLPEQLGDIKGLKMIDASFSAIEELPDSITHLKKLVKLNLYGCKKLRVLPKQFGNIEGLRTFDATDSAIRQLPDSFVDLINLVDLQLSYCKRLRKLPEQFGNMVGLRTFDAGESAIEQLPESFGCLKNLDYLRNVSPTRHLSLSKLHNLQYLTLANCTSLGSSFPELPLNLMLLNICGHTALEQLPDMSYLKELIILNIHRCNNLQSLPTLPPHLKLIEVSKCKRLEELPDLSMLKELESLSFSNCSNLKVIDLKGTSLIMNNTTPFHLRLFYQTASLQNVYAPEPVTLGVLYSLSSFKRSEAMRLEKCINLQLLRLQQPSRCIRAVHD